MELHLSKMRSEVESGNVHYYLRTVDSEIHVNELLGKEISIEYLNEIKCTKCGRITSKSFSQGFCYPCFKTAPETESCVLHPETCTAHEGVARDMQFANENCLTDQIVYFANTGGLKVGVTRIKQMPTRWVDQGAEYALPIAVAPNRYTAGHIEVALKKHFSDKTNWRKMLSGHADPNVDLLKERNKIIDLLPASLKEYFNDTYELTTLRFPVMEFPEKVTALNLEKNPNVSGQLMGIKGQYLLFKDGSVFNVRKFGGYKVKVIF